MTVGKGDKNMSVRRMAEESEVRSLDAGPAEPQLAGSATARSEDFADGIGTPNPNPRNLSKLVFLT